MDRLTRLNTAGQTLVAKTSPVLKGLILLALTLYISKLVNWVPHHTLWILNSWPVKLGVLGCVLMLLPIEPALAIVLMMALLVTHHRSYADHTQLYEHMQNTNLEKDAPVIVHVAPTGAAALKVGEKLVKDGLAQPQKVSTVLSDPRTMLITPRVYVNDQGDKTIVRPNIVVASVMAEVDGALQIVTPSITVIDSSSVAEPTTGLTPPVFSSVSDASVQHAVATAAMSAVSTKPRSASTSQQLTGPVGVEVPLSGDLSMSAY